MAIVRGVVPHHKELKMEYYEKIIEDKLEELSGPESTGLFDRPLHYHSHNPNTRPNPPAAIDI